MLYKTYIEGVGGQVRTLITPHKNKYVFKDKGPCMTFGWGGLKSEKRRGIEVE